LKSTRKKSSEVESEAPKSSKRESQDLKDDLSDILDDIDRALAESQVDAEKYIQLGGE